MYMYHILIHGWNAYLRMIKIDYKAKFTCPICKENPEVTSMDGITLETLKHIPEIYIFIDELQRLFVKTNAIKLLFSSLPAKTKDDRRMAAHHIVTSLLQQFYEN